MSATFDFPRPLHALVEFLNPFSEPILTYEDAPYTLAESVTHPVEGGAHGWPLPHTTPLPLPPDDGTLPSDPAGRLRDAVDTYTRLGNPGRFRILEAPPMIHVIGASTADDPQGAAPLDQPITLPAGTGTGSDFIVEVVGCLNRVGAARILLGQRPFNTLHQRHTWDAQAGRARDVLRAFATSTPFRLGWSLLYGIQSRDYVFNMFTDSQRRSR